MQPDKFRYTIIINEEEVVLNNAPSGWEETFLNWKRSKNYWGMIRSFTVPLNFVLDGAYILREEFYTRGKASRAKLRIEYLQPSTWEYRLVYFGEMDFEDFKDLDNGVEITTTDIGVAEMVASYDKAVYDIVLTEENSMMIELPGVSLIDFANYSVQADNYIIQAQQNLLKLPPIDVIANELLNEVVTGQLTELQDTNNLASSNNWFLRANEATEIVISGQVEKSAFFVEMEIRNQNNEIKYRIDVVNRPRMGVEFQIPRFSATIQMEEGEKLFLVLVNYVKSSNGRLLNQVNINIEYFELRVSNEVISEPTETRAISAFDLYRELLNRMNNEEVEADSVLLKESGIYVTCGDAIRNFENPIIKTSFQDFYNSIDYTIGCGFGIDGIPRLEAKEFFYRNVPALRLGKVKSFALEVDKDFTWNTLKVGYKEQNYELDQGREEFNQGQSWSGPNRKTDKPLERVAPYRADQFGVAQLQRLTIIDNLKGLDTESDNDIWMLKTVDGRLERASDYDFISGISNVRGAFNLFFSPKKNILRSGSFIGIGLFSFEEEFLKFGSAEKNADLVTLQNSQVVRESENILIGGLNDILFLPYLVKITVDMPKNSWSLIDNNLFGYFEFEYKGAVLRGFIDEASNDLGRNTERELSLYLHRDTVLNELIR
jgi:hypothetical protein